MTIERRTLSRPLSLRAADDGQTIGGYAALFNSEAEIAGYFREVVLPGAFNGQLTGDVRALIDHDSGRVIGRTKAGSLRLTQDDKGLGVEIDLPETTDARDLATLIERGDISGMSFGFEVTKQEWDETGDMPLRQIIKVELFEVSVVAFPAYPDTTIAKRCLEAMRQEARQHNFSGAARRLGMKVDLDLRARKIER